MKKRNVLAFFRQLLQNLRTGGTSVSPSTEKFALHLFHYDSYGILGVCVYVWYGRQVGL